MSCLDLHRVEPQLGENPMLILRSLTKDQARRAGAALVVACFVKDRFVSPTVGQVVNALLFFGLGAFVFWVCTTVFRQLNETLEAVK